MKRMSLVLVLVMGLVLTAAAADWNPKEISIVSLAKSAAVKAKLGALNLDRLMEADGRVFLVVTPADLERLDAAGLAFRVETERFAPTSQPRAETSGDINGAFHDYAEVEQELTSLETNYADLAKLYDLGLSLEGRHVYALKISANVQADKNEARILFLGCHHAREWISVEVPLLFAKYAVEHYASDPEIKRLLDRSEVWVVPLVNPDGLEYSIHEYRYWRKNRRDNGDGSFGVDLNRNYGYEWGVDDEGSSPDPSSDIYRGSAAFSEPEDQAVRGLIASRSFQALISYHSYAQDILYPWGYTGRPTPDEAKFRALAAGMAAQIQAVNGRTYTYGEGGSMLYLTNGELTDWAYGLFGMMAFTIELPPLDYASGAFFNAESDIEPIFQENLPAMEYLIDQTVNAFHPSAPREKGDKRQAPPEPRTPIKD
jgi:carboxypeptidase T